MSDNNKLTIRDLQEMDLVMTRSGVVCWVLRNKYTHELQTYYYNMWGHCELGNYYDDFTYGKNVKYFNKKRDCSKDIIKVSKFRSQWKSIWLMRNYENALRSGDQEAIIDALKEFNWIDVDARGDGEVK